MDVQESMEYLSTFEPINVVRAVFVDVLEEMRPYFGHSLRVTSAIIESWRKRMVLHRYNSKGEMYKGVNTRRVRHLPIKMSENEYTEECCICFENHVGMQYRMSQCGHEYHLSCIDDWSKKCKNGKLKHTCPLCPFVEYDPLN